MEAERSLFVLSTSSGVVTANFNYDPPVLFVSKDKRDALRWYILDNQYIVEEKSGLCWDIWDVESPRCVLYKLSRSKNQKWSFRQKEDEISICSATYKRVCVNHFHADIQIEDEPFPFFIQFVDQTKSNKQKAHQTKENDVIKNAFAIRKIYNRGYEFPEWSIAILKKYESSLCPLSKVYYSDGTLEDAMSLTREREPVNIAMVTPFFGSRCKRLTDKL